MIVAPLPLLASDTSPLVISARQVYESKDGSCEFKGLSASGNVYFRVGQGFFVGRDGVTTGLSLPAPPDACEAIGPYGDGIAINVGFNNLSYAVYASGPRGCQRITAYAHLLSGTSATGRNLVGTGYGSGIGIAYRWQGRWIRLPDYRLGAEVQWVGEDGVALGDVTKGAATLPCLWSKGGTLRTLPLPDGYDNGVASQRFGVIILGSGGFAAERTGDIQHYRRALVWRNGRIDRSYRPLEARASGAFYGLAYAQGDDLYGTLTPRQGPSYSRGVRVRHNSVATLAATYQGRRYVIEAVVGGSGETLVGIGHRDGTPLNAYSGALILFHAPK